MARSGETPTLLEQSVEASLKPKSPVDSQMEGSDDEQDEAILKLKKDEL
jgi:hypothetical protein